jgi:integrase
MSVRKRKWVTRSGESQTAWIVDYTDQQGDRHIKTFKQKKEADAHHASVKVDVSKGVHTAPSKSITVAKAAQNWLTVCEKGDAEHNGLERTTMDWYRLHVDSHIVPFLGTTKLSAITTATIRDFQAKLRANGRSQNTTKRVVTSLGSILADAQERGHVAQNVVRSLRSNRRKKGSKRENGKLQVGVDIPTPEEIKRIVAHLKGRWRPLLLTAIFTGLRASELRGLRWIDVDLKRGQLEVHQRADRYNDIGAPKSAAGERTDPLPPILLNCLREWKLKCPKSELDLVFPNGNGNVENHQNILNRGFFPAQVAAKVSVPALDDRGKHKVDKDGNPVVMAKYTGLHALRHFFASWCINSTTKGGRGLPLKEVQTLLGHASVVMTSDRYGHLFPRGNDAAELARAEAFLTA